MRYRLRTLLIVLALEPMVLAGTWPSAQLLFWRYVDPAPQAVPLGCELWVDPASGRWSVQPSPSECSQVNY
jgi:hypothetical protein